ncbi:ATP synthase F0 subcomplex subunit OSCP atp5 [Blastomyces dermatitidis]|uniref:ATP synthase subunit 5, mitochondrial n=3 Tax=Blastomyces TaxID=229219 RepID=A0A179UPG6_BLAGS|nr:ATP synthase F1, delta subunit [Blastomyces gilchristii SLH14081]XP_045274848.1 ATP synthase F1, delta subunit [Blastomyces dermatitidis ER-3]EGE77861.1 ATP synthase F1, delta subunit [Blastomyces dermatitidis ATCC 18188]EQL38155.1 F-type H+-transporting ATPase oligomycin sensitivity conferral protein [Blastomyces dermatitidis ATCC 26199]EEQ87549.1 ATP synthase F1, delta subunit [Blastomyces dermatitidis ER-3]OAT09894.1 ATP synthase F1, delta subunit [Blastomyces gilchristii SLH14081]
MLSPRVAQSTLRATAHQFSSIPRAAALDGVRTYATATASVKPPIALFGVDGTYANALYTASAKSSSLDQTAKAVATLAEVFKTDAKLPAILSTPALDASDKSQIIQELQRVAGGPGKDNIMKNFLATLAENNRLGLLQGVCEKFAALMSAHNGETELVITSAQKLDAKTVQRLEAAIAKSEYSQGKKLKVVTKINSDIVGGLIVEVGERTIDLSVSSKLAKLNKALTDTL